MDREADTGQRVIRIAHLSSGELEIKIKYTKKTGLKGPQHLESIYTMYHKMHNICEQ